MAESGRAGPPSAALPMLAEGTRRSVDTPRPVRVDVASCGVLAGALAKFVKDELVINTRGTSCSPASVRSRSGSGVMIPSSIREDLQRRRQ